MQNTNADVESSAFAQSQSIVVERKPSVLDSSNSECNDYDAMDRNLDVDDSSQHTECTPNQPDDEHKPLQKKMKMDTKNDKIKQQSNRQPTNKQYPCKVCERIFNNSGNLKKHQHLHTGIRPYKCPLCSKS